MVIGGADEDRTHDLRIANATLSQLSYSPLYVVLYRDSILIFDISKSKKGQVFFFYLIFCCVWR